MMKSLVYQTPLVQLVINLLLTILETAGVLQRVVSEEREDVEFKIMSHAKYYFQIRDGVFLFLGLTNVLFFTIGMYGYNVLTTGFGELSQWKNYAVSSKLLHFPL